MRLFIALAVACLAGCSGGEKPAPRAPRVAAPPSLVATINLPGDDGRVHVLVIPGRYESSKCLVHVTATTSTMTCLQQVDSIPAQPAREP